MERVLQIVFGLAALLVGAALTIWFVWRTIKKAEDPGRIAYKWVISLVILVFLLYIGAQAGKGGSGGAFVVAGGAGVCGILLGILWAPHLGAVLARPITSFYDGGDAEPELRPFYSIARAKQKRGKYEEAIGEVRNQLERFPEDYEGWMLMAEIFGNDLKDNLSAQNCLETILQHQGHAPRNIVYTLNRSADWHLQHAADREAARAALEEIVRRFPESEFAHTAAQRISHLTTDQMLADQRNRPTIHLTRHDEYVGLKSQVADPRPPAEEPAQTAARLVEHLTKFPEDAEAREQLATVYADHYLRMDLAADQVEQLIASPGASPKEIAHWLNMLVDFHLRVDGDRTAAEGSLRRIIELFPGTAVAGLAASRLAYLDGEFRKNSKSQVLRLGSYEDKIGLKGQVPKKPV
jgi:tetratricopeptide (TPR) repeat protein